MPDRMEEMPWPLALDPGGFPPDHAAIRNERK
jgi:hypothetical protein